MDNLDNSNNGEYVVLQISKAVQDGRLSDGTLVDDVIRDEIEVTSGATHLEDILGAKYAKPTYYTVLHVHVQTIQCVLLHVYMYKQYSVV